MRVAFTGHRPERFNGRHNEVYTAIQTFLMFSEYTERIKYVITGGALGTDQLAAAWARCLKIPYSVVIPFPEQSARWSKRDRDAYLTLLDDADEVHQTNDRYTPYAFQKRNEFMVNDCDLLATIFDGNKTEGGGTWNCIEYATKVGRPIEHLKWLP
jgi:uncharacterized phage-like protein YoqJ